MKRNRKRSKKMSVIASHSMYVGAVIMMLFVMVIVNLLASSSCDHLLKSIGEKERQLKRLDDEYVRESARWEGMLTTKNSTRVPERMPNWKIRPSPSASWQRRRTQAWESGFPR